MVAPLRQLAKKIFVNRSFANAEMSGKYEKRTQGHNCGSVQGSGSRGLLVVNESFANAEMSRKCGLELVAEADDFVCPVTLLHIKIYGISGAAIFFNIHTQNFITTNEYFFIQFLKFHWPRNGIFWNSSHTFDSKNFFMHCLHIV